MPFFIPGRTKCAICNQVIDNRFDAAQLPYIPPTVSSSLAQLSRRFVHRSCWREWEYTKLFSTAAFNLAKEGTSEDSALKIEFECDGLIVFWVPAMNSYRLQDFKLLVTVDVPVSNGYIMGTHFVSALSKKDYPSTFLVGDYIWKAKRDGSGAVEFTVTAEGQIADKFIIPSDRHSCWLDAMEQIKEKGNEIPTVSASDY